MKYSCKHAGILTVIACLVFARATYAQPENESRRVVVVPRVASGPALRGDLSDPLWMSGAHISDFTSIMDSVKSVQQTDARVMYDSKYLYFGVHCQEPKMSDVMARYRGFNSLIWQDDSIEFMLDIANSQRMYYHLVFNSIGGFIREKGLSDIDLVNWDCRFIIKTGRSSNGWTAELAIPFSDLGITPTKGLVWGFNLCRGRMAGDVEEYSTWNLSPGSFGNPACFGQIILGDDAGKSDGIRLLSWGGIGLAAESADKKTVSCLLQNQGRKSIAYNASLVRSAKGKSVVMGSKRVIVKPDEDVKIEIPYSSRGSDSARWTLTIDADGSHVFKAVNNVTIDTSYSRVWQVKDPLYKELLSNKCADLQRNGSIYWNHTYGSVSLTPFAKEYGFSYSNEEALKELADKKFLPIFSASMFSDPFRLKMADKYNYKVLFMPDVMGWTAPDVPKLDGSSLMIEPRSRKLYMDDLKSNLTKYRKYIWGVYSGDEVTDSAIYQMIRFYETYKNDYPFIREINERVKNEYGFGKYGIPESRMDDNPYRWIAVRRWIMNYLAEWQKEVYETVQSIAPEVKVISFDPTARHKPVGFDRMAPYFDIATQQMFPNKSPNRQQFGFTTKMVSDLTGKPTWPCTHIGHYPFSTTPEEVRELMSQVQRNGGKSFHFWLKDEIGNNRDTGFLQATKWGFPERWRAICEINTLNASMNEVVVPTDPDFAIFYSEDHYQSFSEKSLKSSELPNEPEWAYTFFGPVARTWFKFVNDNMVEDHKVNLSDYKVVIVPAAKFERASVANAMVDYVNAGGTLVIGDPEAFTNDINGDTLSFTRDKLVGSILESGKVAESLKFSADCSLPSLRNRVLSVYSREFTIKPGSDSEIMATFNDGSPAVYRKRIGQGSVIIFASNPFTEGGISDPDWKNFFKVFAKDLGLKTDRDIWRFKFPNYKTVTLPEPVGVCLTGNYVKWWLDEPVYDKNVVIAGTYSYSILPDATADRGESDIAFTTGKLFDRKSAYTTLKKDLRAENFEVTWKTEKPVSVTFDLLQPQNVNRVHFWYAGQLPAVKIESSLDGKNWTKLADSPKKPFVKLDNGMVDVFDANYLFTSRGKARYMRLSFGDRDPGHTMTLAECELWGSKIK